MTDDNIYKIVVIGTGSVGKSALTIQFLQSYFIEEYDPTIEDSYRKQCVVDGIVCLLDILDSAGQAEYGQLRDQYMRTGDGFLCVYSVTSRESLDELRMMIEQIGRVKDVDDVSLIPLLLVGNKTDLAEQREISLDEGETYAQTYHTHCIETSARTRTNVDQIFHEIVRLIRHDPARSQSPHMRKNKWSKCEIL
jgi:GTPase KRas protein